MSTEVVSSGEVSLLHRLVLEQSYSGNEKPVAGLLASILCDLGWSATLDETGNLVASKWDGGKTLLFLGHLDTAPGRPDVRIEDCTLWGRGSVDAKGSLAAFIAAVGRFEREHETQGIPARLVLIGAVGEEAESPGARAILQKYQPDWCVVGEPSGWEGITVGYKGHLPLTVTVRCPEAHHAGRFGNALEAAIHVFCLINDMCAENGKSAFNSLSCSLNDISGTSDGLRSEAVLKITLRVPPALGLEKIVTLLRETLPYDTLRRATVLPEPPPETISAQANRLPPGLEVSWQTGLFVPPYVAPKNNHLVRSFVSAVRAAGGNPRFKLKTGTSDMNIVGPAWNCPILAYGPGDSSLDHTPEEHLPLAEYGQAIVVWQHALAALLET